MERKDALTFKGNPMTLIGPELQVGDAAPDFTLLGNDLSPVSLADTAGKVRLLSVVPSLDTSICDAQTRKFSEALGAYGAGVVGYAISADLPFAQARWCGAAGIENVAALSDHFSMGFGDAYGVHIKELRIHSRAIFVIDGEGVLRYIEYVPEVAQHPDYDAALAALAGLV